jgi:hypothetical protein
MLWCVINHCRITSIALRLKSASMILGIPRTGYRDRVRKDIQQGNRGHRCKRNANVNQFDSFTVILCVHWMNSGKVCIYFWNAVLLILSTFALMFIYCSASYTAYILNRFTYYTRFVQKVLEMTVWSAASNIHIRCRLMNLVTLMWQFVPGTSGVSFSVYNWLFGWVFVVLSHFDMESVKEQRF